MYEVNSFYSNRNDGIQDKWCIGINFPDDTTQISLEINRNNRLLIAANSPSEWNSNYNIIFITGYKNKALEELAQNKIHEYVSNIEKIVETYRKGNI